ncbi:MAG TPA: DNRLRE domain-containing protein [Nocardioidaceae bacterium]|nr:DNRLRE domain-containing protein [Nocardioidaceae bacterium]
MLSRSTRTAAISGGVAASAVALTAGLLTLSAPTASAAVSTFTPVADTYVANNATGTNFGTSGQLGVDNSEIKRSFIRFNVSGITGTVTSAKLRLHVDDVSGSESPNGGTWKLMSNTTWSETGVTWNNQPAIDGTTLGTLGGVARNTWVELDVTGKITGDGTYSIGGTSSSNNGADYDSRETGALAPQLVITTGTTPTPTPTPTTTPPPGDPVLVGAGDISNSGSGDSQTAALINALPNATVFTMGDNVYSNGTSSEFNTYYNPTWGAFKARTKPSPGNHDYNTSGATGYYGYFGSLAGPSGQGYYSYDLGNWHIVSLNSEVSMSAGSAQETWLRNNLAASTKPCTLAYWHKPLFTSGSNHGPDTGTRPLFQALYDFDADVVVTGHNHQYERFAPMTPTGTLDNTNGIREFVAGMGGAGHYSFGTIQPNSQARNSTDFGVLKFTLHSNSYDWEFVPVAGASYSDSGTTACH